MPVVEELLNQLIAEGWAWPHIERIIATGMRWRCRLHSGIPDGPIIEGRGFTIEEAIDNAANMAHKKSSIDALTKAILANAERIRVYGAHAV